MVLAAKLVFCLQRGVENTLNREDNRLKVIFRVENLLNWAELLTFAAQFADY